MAKGINGVGGVVGAVVAATLGLAVGCGESFSEDCHTSRTCEVVAGQPAVDGSPDNVSGTANGGGDEAGLGGSAPTAGASGSQGGMAGAADGACHADAECSNDVPEDGAEVCEKGMCVAGNPPPKVVSVTPEADAVDVEPDAAIVIEFSEPLDPKTVTPANIQVLDGETPVPGKLDYADGKVTFKPTSPLTLLASYTVLVSTGVTDEKSAPLLSEAKSSFAVRDGVWTTITVEKDGSSGVISDQLPMSADGSVLLAWDGESSAGCVTFGGWFLRGEATSEAKAIDEECTLMTSASDAKGVGVVGWSDISIGKTRQYRAGAWQSASATVWSEMSAMGLAVLPTGAVTAIGHDVFQGGSLAFTTNESGVWPSVGDPISDFTNTSDTSLALDSKGNGLAAWRANDPTGLHRERIVVSMRSAQTGKWAKGLDLPGSLATADDAYERGAPAVAVDDEGGAMALWVDRSTKQLMANHFSLSSWEDPEPLSGTLVIDLEPDMRDFAPALVFDGQSFVAAWTALDGAARYTYTARYDSSTGWSDYERQQKVAADGKSAPLMPALASDGRGNLLLVFAKGATGSTYSRVYQRYTNGSWGPILTIPGDAINHEDLSNLRSFPLSVSPNGLAALAWNHYDDVRFRYTVQLASFF